MVSKGMRHNSLYIKEEDKRGRTQTELLPTAVSSILDVARRRFSRGVGGRPDRNRWLHSEEHSFVHKVGAKSTSLHPRSILLCSRTRSLQLFLRAQVKRI